MKKLFLLALLVFMLVGCQSEAQETCQTRVFTDSVGREVTLPNEITKIAVTGPLAQIVVFSIAPDEMVGIVTPWSKASEMILSESHYQLPVLGQLYGGKGEMNLETLLSSGAQIVIDVGEPKETIVSDLDALQEQTNIPFVHITTSLETMDQAYDLLGDLLNKEEEASILSDYCREIYDESQEIASKVDKANVLYCLGDKGQNVIANGSYHGEIIDMMTNNLAVVEQPVSRGTGNEVDMEQIVKWNPDVILFAPDSIYDHVKDDPAWSNITAIKNNQYYQVPEGPYNWMGFPPSVQRYLGLMWMTHVLYPDHVEGTLYEAVNEYFQLFYHSDLSETLYKEIVK